MNIAVVSHDPGGAEVLSAYIKEYKLSNIIYYLKGPAKNIFKNNGLINSNYEFREELDKSVDFVLASMSWQDNIALQIIQEAKKYKIHTEIILDSWYDYSRRFGFPVDGWKDNLPETLIVCDDIAEKIVQRQHLNSYCEIKKIENPYLKEIMGKYVIAKALKEKKINDDLLFISSPLREAHQRGLPELRKITVDEKDLLQDIITICKRKKKSMRVRLHPSQKNTFNFFYGSLLNDIEVCDTNNSLFDDIFTSKYVIGFCSFALVVAATIGKIVISFSKGDLDDIFHWEEFGVLNFFGIKNCKDAVEISNSIV